MTAGDQAETRDQPVQQCAAESDMWAHRDKRESMAPMRDVVCLFTAVCTPKDRSRACPFLKSRTP